MTRALADVFQSTEVDTVLDAGAIALQRKIHLALDARFFLPMLIPYPGGCRLDLVGTSGGDKHFDAHKIGRAAGFPVLSNSLLNAHLVLPEPK
jgi:hypothetical protein